MSRFDDMLREMGVTDDDDALVSAAEEHAAPKPAAPDYSPVIGALLARIGEEKAVAKQTSHVVAWTLAGVLGAIVIFLLGQSSGRKR